MIYCHESDEEIFIEIKTFDDTVIEKIEALEEISF